MGKFRQKFMSVAGLSTLISPKCLRYCGTCAVSSDGPEAAQHTDYITIHGSTNLGNRGLQCTVLFVVVCVCAARTNLSQCDRTYSTSCVASNSWQLFQQGVNSSGHLSLKLWHHLTHRRHFSDTVTSLWFSLVNKLNYLQESMAGFTHPRL